MSYVSENQTVFQPINFFGGISDFFLSFFGQIMFILILIVIIAFIYDMSKKMWRN